MEFLEPQKTFPNSTQVCEIKIQKEGKALQTSKQFVSTVQNISGNCKIFWFCY